MFSKKTLCGIGLLVSFFAAGAALAHYHVVVPGEYAKWSARKGETVSYDFIWGHGFEHIWFDIEKPASFVVYNPDGSKTDLAPALTNHKVKAISGSEHPAYKFEYKPAKRGDHIISLKAGLQWDEEDGVWLQDYVKAVLHVQAETDWGKVVGDPLEVVSMSRPYGILPGGALTFKIIQNGKPAKGLRVERELYLENTPKESDLPSEPFIAYSSVSNDNGQVVFSFPKPGWHGVTAIAHEGKVIEKGGHKGPIVERATLWVYVSPQPE
jgi:uncharacterized GH25 family protein